MNQRALVIGLGSMGKRRIRCLQSLGFTDIVGCDPREDRRSEVESKYGVRTIKELLLAELDASAFALICVPPDRHDQFMRSCTERRRNYFVEASVIDTGFEELEQDANRAGIIAAPSSTMTFHPAIGFISDQVRQGRLGTICHFIYHFGQYLPDWHPYERVGDFYVSKKETGGARELLAFELTWLVRCFGWPIGVAASVQNRGKIDGAEAIDDVYALLLQFPHPASLVVDVISRSARRELTIVGTDAFLKWDWNGSDVSIFDGDTKEWNRFEYNAGVAATGYNKNIGEQMYIDELASFIAACSGGPKFRNTLTDDAKVLSIVRGAEESSRSGATQWL